MIDKSYKIFFTIVSLPVWAKGFEPLILGIWVKWFTIVFPLLDKSYKTIFTIPPPPLRANEILGIWVKCSNDRQIL